MSKPGFKPISSAGAAWVIVPRFICFGRSPVLFSLRGIGPWHPLRKRVVRGGHHGRLPLLYASRLVHAHGRRHTAKKICLYNRLDLGLCGAERGSWQTQLARVGVAVRTPKPTIRDVTLPSMYVSQLVEANIRVRGDLHACQVPETRFSHVDASQLGLNAAVHR